MRFKRFTFSLLSPLIGFHVGRNPVSGQRFVHVAPVPFFGIDFNLPPYDLNDEARAKLNVEDIPIDDPPADVIPEVCWSCEHIPADDEGLNEEGARLNCPNCGVQWDPWRILEHPDRWSRVRRRLQEDAQA